MDEPKLVSNFGAPMPVMDDEYLPIPLPSDHQTETTINIGGHTPEELMMQMLPEPKNYQAIAKAEVFKAITSHGVPVEMNINMEMFDDENGHGKATIITGKDIYRRQFEMTVTVKEGKVDMGKVRDVDSDENVSIADMFKPPSDELVTERMERFYRKKNNYKFFKGKPTDEKIKLFKKKFPSLPEEKIEEFLYTNFHTKRSEIITVLNKHKKIPLAVGGAVLVIIALIILKRRNGQ